MNSQGVAQQIAITGIGGQGVLFLTRVLTECALDCELGVIASETHGMAMRGGSVISYIKVGPYRGPLIRSGCADVMLAMDREYLGAYLHLVAPQGVVYLNAAASDGYPCIDATRIGADLGTPLVANMVLLGFALHHEKLFCTYSQVESVIERISPEPLRNLNLSAVKAGFLENKS